VRHGAQRSGAKPHSAAFRARLRTQCDIVKAVRLPTAIKAFEEQILDERIRGLEARAGFVHPPLDFVVYALGHKILRYRSTFSHKDALWRLSRS